MGSLLALKERYGGGRKTNKQTKPIMRDGWAMHRKLNTLLRGSGGHQFCYFFPQNSRQSYRDQPLHNRTFNEAVSNHHRKNYFHLTSKNFD